MCCLKILCTGLREFRSGKTTLSLALLKYFKENDRKVCGFKPKSGGNLWYHWNHIKKALKKGTIYSKDALKFQKESGTDIEITVINPVHRLWLTDDSKVQLTGLPPFILDRITIDYKQIIIKNQYAKPPINPKKLEKLFENSKVINISNREDLEQITSYYEQADAWAEHILAKSFEILICESYCDIGLPTYKIDNLDYVFAIEPFKLRIYDGIRFLESSKIVSSIKTELKTAEIIEPIKPITKVKVPPFSNMIVENLKNFIKPYLDQILL